MHTSVVQVDKMRIVKISYVLIVEFIGPVEIAGMDAESLEMPKRSRSSEEVGHG